MPTACPYPAGTPHPTRPHWVAHESDGWFRAADGAHLSCFQTTVVLNRDGVLLARWSYPAGLPPVTAGMDRADSTFAPPNEA